MNKLGVVHIKGETMKSAEDLLSEITDPFMKERLASIRQGIQKRQKRQHQKPKSAEIIQLPLWPEPARGVPNSALRGALFAAIQGKNRQYLKNKLLAVQDGVRIKFTGEQLDQSDMDVWEQILHLARQHPLGTYCDFTAHAFLKALGRSTGKAQHEWLSSVIRRHIACAVEMTHNGKTFTGSLVEECFRDERTGHYRLKLNPSLVKLYGAGMWTALDWQQRQQLRRKPLALWLHGYYASHAEPFPIKVETLHRLSGSGNPCLRSYKRQLVKAHEYLKAIGALQDYEIKDGLVYPYRIPSRSQKKHLTRVRPRKK